MATKRSGAGIFGAVFYRNAKRAAMQAQPGALYRPRAARPLERQRSGAALWANERGTHQPADQLASQWDRPSSRNRHVKRALDIALSLALLTLLAPLLIFVAVAIKIDSPGPALYRQRRVGYGGRHFNVFKFRSMGVDAEKNGPQYASANDHRTTRIGRWMRRTRFDEIPQAINVLRGEMSFVGPRPERPEFVAELEKAIPNYHLRHMVKPGITGWAQVRCEYAASIEGAREKLAYDLYYIRHFTPLLDLAIVAMTVRVALFGIGAR